MSAFVALGDVPEIARIREAMKPVSERPDEEKMALLLLRRGNELAKACVEIARKVGWPMPAKHDWRALIACGLVKRDPERGVLVLTATGLMWQERLAVAMAKISGLHALLPHTSDRLSIHVRCTCGWKISLSKNQGHLITGQFTHFGVHLDAVRKGIWQKPRSVEEIVAETIARQTAPVVPEAEPACEPIGATA